MQIGAYTLLFTTNGGGGRHSSRFITAMLAQHFCPVVSAHGVDSSWAVCEDVLANDGDTGAIVFRYYSQFLRSPDAAGVTVIVQEFAPLEHLQALVERLLTFVRNTEGAVLFETL